MLTPPDYQALIERFDRSAARLPFADREHVIARYMDPETPVFPSVRMGKRLREILASDELTGFTVHDLRKAVAGQLIGLARGEPGHWASEMHHVAGYFAAGSSLLPPSNDAWDEAADLGRGLFILNGHAILEDELRWPRELATAAAVRRLDACGVALKMNGADLVVPADQLTHATAMLQETLDELGFVDAAGNLLRVMASLGLCIDGIYIAGRRPSVMRTEPSTPFNFLLQLAARSTAKGKLPSSSQQRAAAWRKSLGLATDIATVLEVEPHGYELVLERRSARLIPLLQEIGLFDALFSFRQWPLEQARFILSAFYRGVDDAALKASAGWRLADALDLLDAVIRCSLKDPSFFGRADLIAAGAKDETLDALLEDMVHPLGTANASMTAPTAQADMMFRPLLEVEPGIWTQVARSLAGPAFYEAIQARLRKVLSSRASSDLVGDGTERVVTALFERTGMIPLVAGLEYDMGPGAEGECDLVFADAERILFVETKGKAISRATQTGIGHAALLDLAGGMLAAQLQGLGHERVIRAHGRLDFVDGSSLPLAGRSVLRLSITLLDHAGLNDRGLMTMLLRTMLNMEFEAIPEADRQVRDQVAKLNKVLRKGSMDMRVLDDHGVGKSALLRGGSMSTGLLALVLADVMSERPPAPLKRFAELLAPLHTYGLLNPFAEYLIGREARSKG
jgi:hypothetical protein